MIPRETLYKPKRGVDLGADWKPRLISVDIDGKENEYWFPTEMISGLILSCTFFWIFWGTTITIDHLMPSPGYLKSRSSCPLSKREWHPASRRIPPKTINYLYFLKFKVILDQIANPRRSPAPVQSWCEVTQAHYLASAPGLGRQKI